MKKRLLLLLSILFFSNLLIAQSYEEIVNKCALGVGENTIYLKDFVIRLPKSNNPENFPVHKANIYLMKGQNYRFTMCNSDEVNSELILSLYDKNKLLISTYDKNRENIAQSFDFSCNKTGLYQLWYSFNKGKEGTGVGIVSLVK